jgi:hypothetical protein
MLLATGAAEHTSTVGKATAWAIAALQFSTALNDSPKNDVPAEHLPFVDQIAVCVAFLALIQVSTAANAGTDCNSFTLFRRTRVGLRNGMTPAAKCRRLATMLYVKADRERDPAIRAEWKCIARGYLILANQFERNGFKDISYASFPPIRDIDEEVA